MVQEIELTWTEFKTLISDKDLKINYNTLNNGSFEVFAGDNNILWSAKPSGVDETDFINNFQTNANKHSPNPQSIADSDNPADRWKIYPSTTPTVLSTDRPGAVHITNPPTQPVNVTIGNVTALGLRFRPRFFNDKTSTVLNQFNDITLANINVDGQLDAVSVNFNEDEVEFIIEIDGTEILRIDLDDLRNSGLYSLSCDDDDDTTDKDDNSSSSKEGDDNNSN